MTRHATRMWATYAWQDHHVTIVQQWHDPYGRPMVRIQLATDEDQATGLPETEFLQHAHPTPQSPRPEDASP